ncbi:hypothetical protein F66182_2377 [Fusarium sp. NRRL 66182]|nr:hypothetical protein F66182_2377 [Fusarium sp. NRRL 66182]
MEQPQHPMKDWRLIPPPKREIFKLGDVRDQTDSFLNVVVRTGLVSFSLQFYQVENQPGCRVHFYMALNEHLQFRDVDDGMASIKGIAMWMSPTGDRLAGEFVIRLLIDSRPFMNPLASFEFSLKNSTKSYEMNLNAIDLINALQGTAQCLPYAEKSNLLRFNFWARRDGYAGYRDALTQWMVRLNNVGIVGWNYIKQGVEDAKFDSEDAALDEPTFDRIIGTSLTSDERLDMDGFFAIHVAKKPIRRGHWISSGVIRATSQNGARLPYEGPPT